MQKVISFSENPIYLEVFSDFLAAFGIIYFWLTLDSSRSGNQISEYICSTFLGKIQDKCSSIRTTILILTPAHTNIVVELQQKIGYMGKLSSPFYI